MIEETNNQQVIVRYLLGLLPDAETERLDELSFTDHEFADSLRSTEKDLVDAYVQGELSGVELERFNTHYLATRPRRERVEFAQALQEWAARNPVPAAVVTEASRRKRKAGNWFSSLFATPRPSWQWAMVAAVLVLGVLTALLLVQNLRLRRQLTQTQALQDESLRHEQELQKQLQSQSAANSVTEQELAQLPREGPAPNSPESKTNVVSLILAPPLRAGGQIHSLTVPAAVTLIKTQLQLDEAADYPAYKVLLVDPVSSQTLWRSGSVNAVAGRKGKTLNITLPAGLVKSQNYVLRVNGTTTEGQSEIIGDYPFKVVKEK